MWDCRAGEIKELTEQLSAERTARRELLQEHEDMKVQLDGQQQQVEQWRM